MAENSIAIQLNISAGSASKSINAITASLKRVRTESDKSIAKLRGLTQAFRIADTNAVKLSNDLDTLADKLSSIAGNAWRAADGMRGFAKASKSASKSLTPTPVNASEQAQAIQNELATIPSANGGFGSGEEFSQYQNALEKVIPTIYEFNEAAQEAGEVVFEYTDNTQQAVSGVDELGRELKALPPPLKEYVDLSQKVKGGIAFREIGSSIRSAVSPAHRLSSALKTLRSAIGRIAFYRMVRSAIKAVTQAYKEGITNLYYYSQALNNTDSTKANKTMDDFATTALYVKNSLGASLMPLLQSLVPVVNTIADAFVTAANAVNQFFHALRGDNIFTKAKRYATEFGDALGGAAGHAKELKKQIFGFDELNIFNEPSGGGGGGGSGLDYSEMFEESELSARFKKLRDIIQKNLGENFLARFKINWKDIISDWGNLSGEDVAEKILTGFFALVGGVAGFAFGGTLGAVVGTLLGVTLGVGFSTIDFNSDDKLSADEIGKMLLDVVTVMTGAVVGWTLGGAKGALLGMSIASSLTALVKTFAPSPAATMEGMVFAGLLLATVKEIVKAHNLKFVLGSSAATGGTAFALGVIAATALTLNIAQVLGEAGYKTTAEKMAMIFADVLNAIVGGVAGAMLLGFAVGGVAGALIGITIACGLNLIINKVFVGYTAQSKRELEQGVNTFTDVDRANMNAYMEFGTPDYSTTPKNRARGKASGGYVEAGTYFYAGENGNPELVGTFGGRVNVTNQEQFTAGMSDIMDNTNTVILQAAQALISTIKDKDTTAVVNISDRAIVNAYDRGKRLAGSGLVV